MFDGKIPHWYHLSCFWKVGFSIWHPDVEVEGFSELRWDDQQTIKKMAETGGATGVCAVGRRGGRPNPGASWVGAHSVRAKSRSFSSLSRYSSSIQ